MPRATSAVARRNSRWRATRLCFGSSAILAGLRHQDVGRTARIGLGAAPARPRQTVLMDRQADIGGPAFARVLALRHDPPASLRLLLPREQAEGIAGPCAV